MPGKILVVEDDTAVAQSLRRLLAREGYYVSLRQSALGARELLRVDPDHDLALLDVGLPGQDGYACCKALRDSGWRAPILMLTGHAAPHERVRGLEAGADDYIAKPFHPAELLARVQAHLRRAREYGLIAAQSRTLSLGPDLCLDLHARDALVRGVPAHLTEREYELLRLMAGRLGEALERRWLFQEIWGGTPDMDIKALAVYVRRLRLKIEPDPDHPRHVLSVRGYGYRLVPDGYDPE